MNGEPPQPADHGPAPLPPNLAQRLVAQSGLSVYEGGNSVFDESVLVYASLGRKRWLDYDVTDHVGTPLAMVRLEGTRSVFVHKGPFQISDTGGSTLLQVKPSTRWFFYEFSLTGVADARFSARATGKRVDIRANDEPFGAVVGAGMRGLLAGRLSVQDPTGREVARIHVFGRGSMMRRVEDLVLAVEPTLRGPLRRILPAVPPVVATVRRLQQQQ